MSEHKFTEYIMQKAQNALNKQREQSVSHRWDHAERVCRRAKKLAEMMKESWKVDMEILEIAALLHDIDQPYYDKLGHVDKSVKRAKEILQEIKYPPEKAQKVLSIILEHSSEDYRKPSTPEAKILFDADKLDGLGAIGIARVFSLCGQEGMTPLQAIQWYKRKIRKAMNMMQTQFARQIVEEKLLYVNAFFERYAKEEKDLL